MTRFFYIKKQQKNVEDHYWKGEPLKDAYPLTETKIISEVIGLAFYQMMGVRTPKTYVGDADCGPVIISQKMQPWHPFDEYTAHYNQQLEPLPATIVGLAELELASAFLGDIDVLGWLYDNIGIQEEAHALQKMLMITKHDAGSAIVENDQFNHFKKYFEDSLEAFPEGTMTLIENDSLESTYLKVFTQPNITKYNEHYQNIFINITKDMRSQALRQLFTITSDDIQSMVSKISNELNLQLVKQQEIIGFMNDRMNVFKMRYSNLLDADFTVETSNTTPFKKLTEQHHILRDKKYLASRFEIQPKDATIQDYSQSAARYFKKLPKESAEFMNAEETMAYFR